MKLTHISGPPQASKDRLIAVLVSEGNLSETQNFVKKNYGKGMEMGKDFAAKGAINPFYSATQKMIFLGLGASKGLKLEGIRRLVHSACDRANELKLSKLSLVMMPDAAIKEAEGVIAQAETVLLSNYQFLVYKSDKKTNSLAEAEVYSAQKKAANWVKSGSKAGTSSNIARDLVNEPVITLTAEELAKRAQALGKKFGFEVDVLNKAKIQSLKMGGLLSVNLGSVLPPTFTIMEHKPAKAVNKKPIVLVGKGVVYDTGGLSLKPTANSMDFMKSDMAGGATVIGVMCGLAAMKVPLHVVGLVPATDNRPGLNAYTPGDVITMYDGTTVEVMNTDAEGRLLLADALTYAKKYKPELVIDLATLTGAQVISIGTQGAALMSNASEEVKNKLRTSGQKMHERVAELPLWDEYGDQLKSDIADLKNIGGKPAGSITAGKFLEHFTDYPWVHLDIAGPAFLPSADSYRPKNGTGFGVRLLLDFLENYA